MQAGIVAVTKGLSVRTAVAIVVCLSIIATAAFGPCTLPAQVFHKPADHHAVGNAHHDHHQHHNHSSSADGSGGYQHTDATHSHHDNQTDHKSDCDGTACAAFGHCCLALVWPTAISVLPPYAPQKAQQFAELPLKDVLGDSLKRPPKLDL